MEGVIDYRYLSPFVHVFVFCCHVEYPQWLASSLTFFMWYCLECSMERDFSLLSHHWHFFSFSMPFLLLEYHSPMHPNNLKAAGYSWWLEYFVDRNGQGTWGIWGHWAFLLNHSFLFCLFSLPTTNLRMRYTGKCFQTGLLWETFYGLLRFPSVRSKALVWSGKGCVFCQILPLSHRSNNGFS
jgi:hypothetical protein